MTVLLEDLKSAELIEPGDLVSRLAGILAEKKAAGDNSPMPTIRQDEEGHVVVSKGGSILVPETGPVDLRVPDLDSVKSLVSARGMEWRDEYKDRVIPYFASDERVDGHGDIVRQSWIMDEFEKNSPMPYSHEWFAPPIGRSIDWRVVQRNEPDYTGDALWLLALFATKDDWEWADTIFRLVKSGFLPSGSVGFWSAKVIDVKDDDERAELGLGRWGLVFEENHLLEYSPTTIPANAGAHTIARSLPGQAKNLQPHDVTMLRELIRQDCGDDRQAWINAEQSILQVARSIWPDGVWEYHWEQDVPVTMMNPPRTRTRTRAVAGADVPPEEPVDMDTRLETIETGVSHIARSLDDFKSETTQIFSDLRELLEASPPKGSGTEVVESANESVDKVVLSLEEALANLSKLRPSS
jgi:hypothetical protein